MFFLFGHRRKMEGTEGSMEAGLLAALEQLEAVEVALLTNPTDPDLLHAKLELAELLTLSSLLHASTTDPNNLDPSSASSDGAQAKEKVADMFGGDDEEWERTHEREFAQHTERQQRPLAPSSAKRKRSGSDEDEQGSTRREPDATTKEHGDGGDGEEDGWLACRVVTTETTYSGRQRRVWSDALLHSRKSDDGRYRVTLLHSRLTQEVRPEDVLLQGTTLKHLNHAVDGDDDVSTTGHKRRRRRRTSDDSDGSDGDFEGFSLMHATGNLYQEHKGITVTIIL
jgi:hypothetical protein